MTVALHSALELYAHALAIEREATARYREFAAQMADRDQEALASLFLRLAALEQEHARQLEARTVGMTLPVIPDAAYRWLDAGAPETAAHEWIFRLLTPYDALRIALAGENRACRFFERMAAESDDDDLRALALEMAAEEREHAALLERALAHEPDPHIDWERALETARPT